MSYNSILVIRPRSLGCAVGSTDAQNESAVASALGAAVTGVTARRESLWSFSLASRRGLASQPSTINPKQTTASRQLIGLTHIVMGYIVMANSLDWLI